MPTLPEVARSDMDGIPVFAVDGPRPFTAELAFRVGIYDESLRERGITHLVEHLSLHALRDTEIRFNGIVSPQLTSFIAQGHPDEVGTFLRSVCRSIHHLSLDRLDTEADVLRREGSLRRWSHFDTIMWAYFGFRGPGVGGVEELGLAWLPPAAIEEWADRYFTRRNAAILIVGDVPEAFGLELPHGEPMSYRAPDRSKPAPESPTLFNTQQEGVTWGTLLRHAKGDVDPEFYIGLDIAAQRLKERLRHELGHTYAIEHGWHRIDADYIAAALGFACEPNQSRAVAVEHLAVMQEFTNEGPTQDEIDRAVRITLKAHDDHPQILAQHFLRAEAETFLAGWGSTTPEHRYLSQWEDLTPESVAERFAEAYRQSYTISNLRPSEMTEMQTAAQLSQPPISGVQYVSKRRHRREQATLIRIGEKGISLRYADGWVNNTIDELAIVIPEEPGIRVLGDKTFVGIESERYVSSSPFRKRAVRLVAALILAALGALLALVFGTDPVTFLALVAVMAAIGLTSANAGDEYEKTARWEPRLSMQAAVRRYLPPDLLLPEPRHKGPS